MGHHDFTETERKQYEVYNEMYGEKNGHFAEVLKSGKWSAASRYGGLRDCWYCGSLHPLDLLELFESGKVSDYSGSDWKYGYPHKFYIDVDTGKPAVYYYTLNGERISKEEWDKANADRSYGANALGGRSMGTGIEHGTGVIHAKFYTEHLLDVEDPETFNKLATELEKRFHIRFEVADGKLRYAAPAHGYQV